jgi:hypothetical protein
LVLRAKSTFADPPGWYNFYMRSREDFQKFITSFHTSSKVYSPDFDDLYFLYRFVREKSIVSILEYGSG